ncbi:vacuolar sorting protein 39 isoform X2 [Arachis hypogaea]|uniref:vacuolar sorting protein 39 isoform X2 n=1 Tax=Arachis hypogaea TaxID=3818 RepID=UPI000DECA96C|nr:vacuolar sorting protein 39 isoform X2 [Arachis hypogaea]
MVHNAYDSFELLYDCDSKIESVESYGSKILLGCSDGSLRIYAPPPPPPKEVRKEPYTLEKNIKSFAKRPVVALEVVESKGLLFALSESIAIHGLPSFETVAVIGKAKGANLFCWDDSRGYLGFARQKRVCIFKHDGGKEFVEVKDHGVPDMVKSMCWVGENICLGIRKEYVILNAMNGSLSEMFASGRLASPLVVPLPSGELLLGKDNIGVLVDQNRKLIPEGRICWSEAPIEVVTQKPYAIALLPRFVEIRSLRGPYALIQTVVLRNVRHIHQRNNYVILALDNSVYGLFPVPLGAQIVQLAASGNFEEALSLCNLLPPEDSCLRTSKEASIHIRYAHFLFDNQSYEEAMEHFLESQVEISYVLSLYPSIILPKTSIIPEPEKLIDISGDDSYLSRGSSGVSEDNEHSPTSNTLESNENAALELKKMSYNMLMALIKFLQKKRNNAIEKATAEGTEEVVLDAVGDSFTSHNSNRVKKTSKERTTIPISSQAREIASILDTALLQAFLLTGQSLMAEELLKGVNYCDLKICEEILQEGNYHIALLELYKCNSMHREALKLVHKLVEASRTCESDISHRFKPETMIEYLKPLCGTDPILVLEFSMLVLESCPNQTIELFLSGDIPAEMVNAYLKQHAPNMQAIFLELMHATHEDAIIENLQDELLQAPELALSYCDRVYESILNPSVKSPSNIYLMLLQIYLNPRRSTNNFEKKITNLLVPKKPTISRTNSKLTKTRNRGSKKIAAIEIAEDTKANLNKTNSGKSDVDEDEFIGEGDTSIMVDDVLHLLSRRWDRINGALALKLLPKQTKLQNLLPFLGPLLRKSSEVYRNCSVIKRLRQSENLQVKDELYEKRKVVLEITGDDLCSLCQKKIGTSVFAVYPNGKTLVHFVCFKDSQSMKAVLKGSPLKKNLIRY